MRDPRSSDRPPDPLIRQIAELLSLPYRPVGSAARPSRAGELYQVQLGEQFFALKLYGDDGYHNDAFFFDTLASTTVPVPRIHARDDSHRLVGQPWMLMDWLRGNQEITDEYVLGKHLGLILREIHAIPVEGAGGRTAQGWEFTTWHDLVEIDTGRDRQKIAGFMDSDENKQLFLAIVDEFARLARLQPNRSFLLHGDLGLDNMVIHDNRVVGLIDSGWFIGGNPLLDVSYLMNHVRIGAGEAKRGFFEGYGDPDLEGRHDLMVFRAYHQFGKLIYFSAMGAREKYEQRRTDLRGLAAKIGFR